MNNKTLVVVGAVCLLLVGVYLGSFINKPLDRNIDKVASVTGVPTIEPTSAPSAEKGTISGFLTYPSEGIPAELEVCAQKIDDTKMISCVKQIRDKKYETGVGYQMDLSPGNYYVYAMYKDLKAYYDEFVICGLKETCKSHTKIPVVVTAGSTQDQILPQDWYDTTLAETVTPTVKPTIKPEITLIKINPNIIKIVPNNTPTPIPTIAKINKVIIPQIQIKPGI